MRYFSVIFLLVAAMMATPAAALDLTIGQDAVVKNFYDVRTYHESHPASATPNDLGGWRIGLNIYDPLAAEVGEVRLVGDSTKVGAAFTISQTEPWVYPFLGKIYYDYSIYLGHKAMVSQPVEFQIFDLTGARMMFNLPDGTQTDSIFVFPSVTAALPPVCKIKHMAIMKTGELKVKFTAPYDDRNSQIRIRVYNAEGNGAETQFKYNPPYQIVKNDGTVVPDKMLVLLPEVYAGRKARIEYRVFEEDGFMSRGMTFFKLPSLEE